MVDDLEREYGLGVMLRTGWPRQVRTMLSRKGFRDGRQAHIRPTLASITDQFVAGIGLSRFYG